ncbi:5'-3' exonuclease H3TH domain-containing protein [Metamycoplasma hyosynoviae]|uniref:5'-3' exonuclease n=1 Tax=Metamycoplasma hyosynoviae TaxID=29559 RepID=A0A063YGZ4_9BACT|nr:5'-3' exonuclease H3TH domain-containing protein [Metamycoplasma hyosynoviae]KDE43542.1 DNA polymerase I [Metamycoplasma hyosynoviae]MDC8917373.1 5'-3' exonuclease H3TH domain-containing protein [Metamycoplasma hyosynoviae]MDC8920703.1 5'-3' exonuclease H3TH domain-containing protein [Metamycoplasma hyosynoviae]MDD1366332.1 5'-3' exonuclease H3TH domain-containing protein [Metamycoplasma hyosynoviae]MDD7837788.1 5'-3' exonuclease H3TH domain-containing protein [Metamycoplasma hyosynoviae]
MNKNKILIIDGTFLAYKAFYATLYNSPIQLANSEGKDTNEIVAFFNTLIALLKFHKPSHLFIAFDSEIKTFRHEMFQEYKSTRKKAPSTFYNQLNVIKKLLTYLNIKNLFVNGYEADDIIAKVTKLFQDKSQILIYSGDQDLNQLISDNVSIIKKIKSQNVIINNYNFDNYYEYLPSQVVDYKAIVGDSSDNFKGIPGLGCKTAISLLQEFDSLEEMYDHIEEIESKSVREKLIKYKDKALFDRFLAILNTNFEIDITSLDDISISHINLTDKAINILKEFELQQIKDKLESLITSD